jgi:predicted transcriptional regulator
MPTARDEIPDRLRELVECSENLRIALLEYGQATVELDALIAGGTPTIEALERAGASRLRPELTDALDQFAGARHRSRVALLFGAVEEGASMAEAGRAFSVSRQLVSRLIAEHQRDAGGAAL